MQKASGKKKFPKTALVITTISAPNKCLKLFAEKCHKNLIDFIVIGDKKSPENFSLKFTDYLSVENQLNLDFSLAKDAPTNHYSRKNIGYLRAIANGSQIILETDDDNFPYQQFWKFNSTPQINTQSVSCNDWINVYRLFTNQNVWARGFPLELVDADYLPKAIFKKEKLKAPIQQGLADIDADVDALFRLSNKSEIKFTKGTEIALGKNTWSPFNSQNTVWHKIAFPLLYLPATCSSRLTDIWRSYVAQRICFDNNWHVLFQSPTVYHQRNQHNLLKDFEEEYDGYLNNYQIKKGLEKLKLKPGEKKIPENLLKCYEWFVKHKLLKKKELFLLECWISDNENLT
ncbi:MAG: DUF288 domain-containing protein [Bacteroidetes bacterium]|nr:DUF288 domain-containing protein [Bacteroidota bacterium]